MMVHESGVITVRSPDVVAGLRVAKKIARNVRTEIKGESSTYAHGFRDALRHVEQDINRAIKEAIG